MYDICEWKFFRCLKNDKHFPLSTAQQRNWITEQHQGIIEKHGKRPGVVKKKKKKHFAREASAKPIVHSYFSICFHFLSWKASKCWLCHFDGVIFSHHNFYSKQITFINKSRESQNEKRVPAMYKNLDLYVKVMRFGLRSFVWCYNF